MLVEVERACPLLAAAIAKSPLGDVDVTRCQHAVAKHRARLVEEVEALVQKLVEKNLSVARCEGGCGDEEASDGRAASIWRAGELHQGVEPERHEVVEVVCVRVVEDGDGGVLEVAGAQLRDHDVMLGKPVDAVEPERLVRAAAAPVDPLAALLVLLAALVQDIPFTLMLLTRIAWRLPAADFLWAAALCGSLSMHGRSSAYCTKCEGVRVVEKHNIHSVDMAVAR
ncbi:MAG: hypothetical protein BZ138_06500 [Methanosphaera sp. rholeuAM270]|nr:MAG: hypothetical protein BZ138_06500 [Methanosphaera sp. rholeuAM270]